MGNEGSSFFEDLTDKYVLDLGCGAGILGLLALKAGATVHFQDYVRLCKAYFNINLNLYKNHQNREIVSKVTIQNVILNNDDDDDDAAGNKRQRRSFLNRSRFYAGDWTNYVAATSEGPRFDIILTCETIYNPANNQKIVDTLKQKLRKRTGVAYLAAKTYYFGVGGGLRAFEALVRADGALRTETLWTSTENVQREILKITHHNDE